MKPTLTLAVLFATTIAAPAAHAADCDRECLRGVITQYLDAMVAHKPDGLVVGDKVRFTENTVAMKLGDGLWKNASGIGTYRQDILDVRQGIAASQVIVEESGMPVMLMLRLKIADKTITEVETQVTRSKEEGAIFNIANIKTVSKGMNLIPERAQLNSRADAIKIAEFYPAGLKIGSFVEVNAPFAADAYRIENGAVSAGPGCSRAGCENIKAQTIMKHPAITSRVALSSPVRTTSSRTSPSPTLIWLVEDPATRSTSFLTTAASPTRVCAWTGLATRRPVATRKRKQLRKFIS